MKRPSPKRGVTFENEEDDNRFVIKKHSCQTPKLVKKLTKMKSLANSENKSHYLKKGQTKNLHPNFFNLT